MIDLFPFAGFTVAVLGLGPAGRAACRALQVAEAEVWAWDVNPERRAEAEADGIETTDLGQADWRQPTTLVTGPEAGHLPARPHPLAEAALGAGAEVISDLELLVRGARDAIYVGVTGALGKSSVTALIGHVLQVSGREAEVGGDDLGPPPLSLYTLGPEGTYVLEMPAEILPMTPSLTFDVAVLTNLAAAGATADAGQAREIFRRQTEPRAAVVGIDDRGSRDIFKALKSRSEQRVIPISGRRRARGGVYALDGILHDDIEGHALAFMDLGASPVFAGPDMHFAAAAAYAAARSAGVEPRVAAACLNSYPGLVHRHEVIARIDGVDYINCARATSPELALRAVKAYDRVVWITNRPADTTPENVTASIPVTAGDLAQALVQAAQAARAADGPRPVVLYAPAEPAGAAGFEARGEAFRDLVEALPGERSELS